jgi:GNAT superfamily N-acetyltransferase
VPSLDQWLRLRAWPNAGRHFSRVFVLAGADEEIIGYYALATATVIREHLPGALRRNAPDPIPAVVIGRLAVDRRWQGQGQAANLLRDALDRCRRALCDVGFAVIVVTPVDATAQSFWEHWGFTPVPGDAPSLYLPSGTLGSA